MAQPETETHQEQETTCYRHPRRVTNVRCSNCDRPICSDCMRPSPVGMRCPECAPRSKPIFDDSMIVTKSIIALCVIVFLAQLGTSSKLTGSALANTIGNGTVTEHAWLYTPAVYNGEWWRLVTSGFAHASVIHIAFNMYFIWAFGQLLEPAFGKLKYLLLYLACLLGGSLAVVAFGGFLSPALGASTGGFGLLGAALMVARLRDHKELQQNLIGLAVIQFAFTFFVPGISVEGHIGGFVTGLLMGYIAFGPLERKRQAVVGAMVAACVALFAAGVVASHVRANQWLKQQNQIQQVGAARPTAARA